MLSNPHAVLPPFSRTSPLLVLDYGFIKHANNDRFLTVLVGRVYPSRTLFAVPCGQKGPDPFVTRRLVSFIRTCGLLDFSCMCDQEGALRTMVQEAIQLSKGRGEWLGALPQNSAVGESQSNGRAERAVQRVEDHVRTLLGELECRLGQQLEPDHPALSWLVEYSAVLLNKYHVNESTGRTAFESLRGSAASERLAHVGERVFFLVPKRRRRNMDLR